MLKLSGISCRGDQTRKKRLQLPSIGSQVEARFYVYLENLSRLFFDSTLSRKS
jgi:hypothetical protein